MNLSMSCCFGMIGAALVRRYAISVVVILSASLPALAQREESKTASHVKVLALADKPNETGQQVVTIFLEVDEKYYLIGNQVPEDLESMRFQVKFLTNGKPAAAAVTYPAGQTETDKFLGEYSLYTGKLKCLGKLQRQADDTSPIEIAITMRGFSKDHTY